MDFFGVSSPPVSFPSVNDNVFPFEKNLQHEKVKEEYQNMNEFSMEKQDSFCNGFGCQNVNCNNREAVFGTTYLPYCNDNKFCMTKNLEYLILENTKLNGIYENKERNQYKVDNEYGLFPMDMSEDKLSPKRKREETLRKDVAPKPKRLFTSV